MFEILRQTVEWQMWGWNLATLSFLFTLVFTLIDGWGYKKQGETIWEHESAESVSAITFFYAAGLCYSYSVYALFIGSIAVLFNGLVLGYNIIPILHGILKFKDMKKSEKICCMLFSLMIPAMLFLPWKGEMFFLFMSVGLASLAMQPLEMWRNKNAGDVDIRAMTVFVLGVFFWAVYGFFVGQSPEASSAEAGLILQIVNSIAFLLYASVIVLWFFYRKENGYVGKGRRQTRREGG